MRDRFDLICVGRATIDLNVNEIHCPMEEASTFTKYVGGSPANIAVGASRLGLRVAFIGKVSDDQHGYFIRDMMRGEGVDVSHLVVDGEGRRSGLTFTEIRSPTECSILMYRDRVADLYLCPEDMDPMFLRGTRMLLLSGTALAQSPSREAIFRAAQIARESGVQIIFELDYRPYSWRDRRETSIYYKLLASFAHIVIGTRDEFDVLESLDDWDDSRSTAQRLLNETTGMVVIKHGVLGSFVYTHSEVIQSRVFRADVIKTFGAGDAFASAFIFALLRAKDIRTALDYGAASASHVISEHSCSRAMPTESRILEIIAKGGV